MLNTHIGNLKAQLEAVVAELKTFDDYRSPVNRELVELAWDHKGDRATIKVAVLDYTGHFYRGRIESRSDSTEGAWDILCDDGELVPGVSAARFMAVRLEVEP